MMTTLFRLLMATAHLVAVGAVVASCSGGDETAATLTPDGGTSDASAEPIDRDGTSDASVAADAKVAVCNQASPFGAPVLSNLSKAIPGAGHGSLSENRLVATFVASAVDSDGATFLGVSTARRTGVDQPWSTPVRETVFDAMSNTGVSVTEDGLTMAIDRRTMPTSVWIAQRVSTSVPWNAPTLWSEGDVMPTLMNDGSALYFVRGNAVYRAPRTAPHTYGTPVKVAWATTPPSGFWWPMVTPDELTLYFGGEQSADTHHDIYVSRRAKAGDPWGAHTKIAEVTSIGPDFPSWVSSDGCELWFGSYGNFGGGPFTSFGIWVARRGP